MSFQSFKLSGPGKPVGRPPKAAIFEAADDEAVEQAVQSPSTIRSAAEEKEAGDAAAAAGEWGRAVRHWDAALATSPADAYKLHESKAQVLLEAGDDWRAVQSASKAVELQPGWATGHLTLARAQLNMGEPELALASMERVLQLAPAHPEAAVEVVFLRTMVLQRQRSGSTVTGQRARVLASAAPVPAQAAAAAAAAAEPVPMAVDSAPS